MTVVGEISLPVIATPGTFTADLVKITTDGAAKAGKLAGAEFVKSFSTALRDGGFARLAGSIFADLDTEAAQAGIASGRAFSSGFTESVATATARGGSPLAFFGVGSAEAGGVEAGRVYARGFTEGITVNGQSAIIGNDARTIAGSEAAGVASGRAYSRGMTAAQGEGGFQQGLVRSLQGAEAGAAGSGRRAGFAFLTSFKGALAVTAIVATVFPTVEAAKFDQQLALIQTQAGASASSVKVIGDEALRLAPIVGIGPTKLAEAFYHAESAGFSLRDSIDLVTAAAKASDIGQADLEKTTQAVIATTASGIKGVSGFADATNLILKAVGTGDVRLPQFVQALSTGIVPAAKSAGLSFEDVAAAIATLTDNVVPANVAATRLRTGISQLADPVPKVRSALEGINLSGDALAQDFQKPQGLLVALKDIRTHLEEAFPADGGAKLSISQQKTALLEYTGQLKEAGITGTDLTKRTNDYAKSLANGTTNLVRQNQVLETVFGGARTGSALITLYEETDRYEKKLGVLGTTESRAQYAAEAWAKQQSLLSQRFKDFTAGLDAGIIKLGHGLTPAFSALLGWVEKVPHFLAPVGDGLVTVWTQVEHLGRSLEPAGKLIATVFGAAAEGAIQGIGFVLRDVVAPAIQGVADGFDFLDRNKAVVVGLAGAITTLLLPAMGSFIVLAGETALVSLSAVFGLIASGIADAAGALIAFVAANPELAAAALIVGGLAAAFTLLDSNTTQTKVDVDALTGAIKTQVQTMNSADLDQGILGQIAKWDVGSHHQTGIDYLAKYGVAAKGLASDLASPANAGAWQQFIKDLNLTGVNQQLWSSGVAGVGNFTKALKDGNPVVREFATLFQNLAKDPSVNQETIVKLEKAFDSLTTGIDRQRQQILEAQGAQRGYGQTFVSTSDETAAAIQNVIDTAGKGQAAIEKINNALRVDTDSALQLVGQISTWNDNAAQSQQQLASAQQSLTSANSGLTDKQNAYNTALAKFGATSPQAKAAYGDVLQAIQGVSSAQDALNKAQPPSVQSILQRLGLDDASLKQLSGAANKLISEGISAPALKNLLDLNDPRAILAFSQGGQSAVSQLNTAVGKFLSDSGPNSFAALNAQYKAAGTKGVENYIDGQKAVAQKLIDEQNDTFIQSAGLIFNNIKLLAEGGGSSLPGAAADGINQQAFHFLDALSSTFTGPQRSAVHALEVLALQGGTGMTTNLANSIAKGTPIVVSKATATKAGINRQLQAILQSIGIHIVVKDDASPKIQAIAKELGGLAAAAASAGVGAAGIGSGGDHPIRLARGGPIKGPGTTTSDSILGLDALTLRPTAFVSRDEYVLNARAYAKHRPLVEAINADGLAAGGPVTRPSFNARDTLNPDALLDRMIAKLATLGGGRLVTAAAKYLGSPYVLGGNPYIDPFASDCSGLVDRAFADIGHRLPGRPLTYDLEALGQHVPGLSAARPGDLLMMEWGEGGIPGPGHVGIYTGPGRMIHDPTPGGHVEYINIWQNPGDIRRLLGPGGLIGTQANGFGIVAGSAQKIAAQMLADRGQGSEFPLLNEIATEESGWNVHAQNPSGAYGIPQALPGNKMASAGPDWRDDAATQLRWMLGYIDQVYGGLPQAVAFHRSHGWYGDGGIIPGTGTADNVPIYTTPGEGVVNLRGMDILGPDGLAWLNAGGKIIGPGDHAATGGVTVGGESLSQLHKEAAAANKAIADYLRALAAEAKKQQEAQQRATTAYLKALQKQQQDFAKIGVKLAEGAVTAAFKSSSAALTAAVKEGSGPLAVALERRIKAAQGSLYGVGLNVIRDKVVTGREYATVQASAKNVTDLTAQLTKLNTVNQTLVDNLKSYVQAEQQYQSGLNSTLSSGAGFTDILKLSGSPADIRTTIGSKLADVKNFTTKIGQLIKRGFSAAIVRDVASDGIQNGVLYADELLTSTPADVLAINKGFGDLGSFEAFSAFAVTKATESGKVPGITQASAVNNIQTAIFTTGANVDDLIGKAEYIQRTFDTGGYLYPGQTILASNASGGREKILNPAETAAWESGASGGGTRVVQNNNFNGVDLPTAQAQAARELVVALTTAGIGR